MKSHKPKKFTFKSYICSIKECISSPDIFKLVPICILVFLFFAFCHKSPSYPKISEFEEMPKISASDAINETAPAESIAETEDLGESEKRCLETALLYKELYVKAEKTVSDYYLNTTVISQNEIDKIEIFLSDKGYPVVNSDSKYPAYLENSDGVYEFWKAVSENNDAQQELITISPSGGLYYALLQYSNGQRHYTGITVAWDENNEPFVSETEHMEVLDWDLTDSGDFYYQIYSSRRPYDDYILVRLKAVNKTLYELTDKYLSPIGYISNNMFVCDWSCKDYGELSFNDLLEFFYKIKNKDYFYAQDYPIVWEPYYHSYIPSSLFESTIMPYFDISLKEFRKRSLYDSENDTYPWQEVCSDNLTFYPTVEPEVVKYRDNGDGTFTLTVHARCDDYKTDCVFAHEVVIRSLNNGGYQYLSNKITYKSNYEMPPNYPRLPEQRNAHH